MRDRAAALAILVLCLLSCGGPHDDQSSRQAQDAPDPDSVRAEPSGAPPPFRDATAEAGLNFVHFSGRSGELYYTEMLGGGGALFDYDGDGDLDVYAVQGHVIGPGKTLADVTEQRPLGELRDRLYRNDSMRRDGRVRVAFTDVTAASGIDARGYGMGTCVGDFDGDGWDDLYVTNDGPNQLFRNRGDGTFEDVTASLGVGDPAWSTSCAFFDADGDGRLDLFVGNYVDFSFESNLECRNLRGRPEYCGPRGFDPVPNRLFRNRGDGAFEDVTSVSGVGREYGGALGVAIADFDGNGLDDVYVANDGRANQLWMNRGEGKFVNEAMVSGSALNADGEPEASMGVVAGDFDDDGLVDLFMTHLAGETNTLYLNRGGTWFEDRSLRSGLGASSTPLTGFGTGAIDYDNDGWLDVFVANGAVATDPVSDDRAPMPQRNQLFRNLGGDRFEDVSASAGEPYRIAEVSRGAAFGDVDDDGDTDVLLWNNAGTMRLLLNEVGHRQHWIGLRVLTVDGLNAIGASVRLEGPDGRSRSRRVGRDGSYCSASDPRVLFGLGHQDAPVTVTVRFPDGAAERWTELPLDSYSDLRRGAGEPVK